jgi:hypothetical protein
MNIYNVAGLKIFGSDTATGQMLPMCGKKGEEYEAMLDITLNLSGGDYFMDFGVAESTPEIEVQDFLKAALPFHVYYEPNLHTDSIVNLQHSFSAKNCGAQING